MGWESLVAMAGWTATLTVVVAATGLVAPEAPDVASDLLNHGHEGAFSGEPPGSQDGETWFLHVNRDCASETLCNCGSVAFSMDKRDSQDDCDGHGHRDLPQAFPGACGGECWPASEPMTPHARGTLVEGVLYVTNDAAGVVSGSVTLYAGDVAMGSAQIRGLVVGLGGYTYDAMPFAFRLTDDLPADEVRFEADLEGQSYFIGYEGDHASYLRFRS